MPSRNYGQSCSLAGALDRIGERWSLLIVRELSLGPLRFSELARAVGGSPTDVLTRRLRDLESHGIVERRELPPPISATVYELTEVGRELERPMIELGRWGMNFQQAADVAELAPSSLPNALRVILRPPADASLVVGLHSQGQGYMLRVDGGWIDASRGEASGPDLRLSGSPRDVIAALVLGDEAGAEVEIDGDRGALEALRSMVSIPERLRAEALAEATASLAEVAASPAGT
jgi:DNA-binding HxlR family transcriptional regulator/fructose-specific component phosphotransferase system IIB-like protein